jgi:hypothetical protein
VTDPSGLGFWSILGGLLEQFFSLGYAGDLGGIPTRIDLGGVNSGIWNEQVPITDGSAGDSLNLGGVFGGGSNGGVIFSLEESGGVGGTVYDWGVKFEDWVFSLLQYPFPINTRRTGWKIRQERLIQSVGTYQYPRTTPRLLLPGANYCGPGSRGGRSLNGTDEACRQHDVCYEASGLSAIDSLTGGGNRAAKAVCDQQLCNKLKNTVPNSSQEARNRLIVGATFGCKP